MFTGLTGGLQGPSGHRRCITQTFDRGLRKWAAGQAAVGGIPPPPSGARARGLGHVTRARRTLGRRPCDDDPVGSGRDSLDSVQNGLRGLAREFP